MTFALLLHFVHFVKRIDDEKFYTFALFTADFREVLWVDVLAKTLSAHVHYEYIVTSY
jgi:hypothetical protein